MTNMFATTTMATTITPENTSTLSSNFSSTDFRTASGAGFATANMTMFATTTQGDGQNFRFEDPVQRIILGCVHCPVVVVGFTGNFMVILAVILSRKLQTRTNAFVVNLAVADMLTSIALPFNALALFNMSGWPLPMFVCSIIGYVYFTGLACSIVNMAAIAINRFVIITKSMATYQSIYTPKKIAAILVLIWAYPMLVCSLPFFGLSKWGYSKKYKSCGQDNSHELSNLWGLVGSLLVYPVPLIILFVCYFKIYRHITGHMKKMTAKEIEMTDASSTSTSSTRRLNRNRQASFSKRQVEITKNLFYVVCAFVACLAPFAITLVVNPNGPAIPWTGTLVIFNSCINPLIYGAKHPHFKEVFRHMLRCRYHMIPEPSSCLRKISSK